MDGRGSEGRGLRWRDSLDIGNTDVDDQLQAVRSLSLSGWGYSHIFERNARLIFYYLNISNLYGSCLETFSRDTRSWTQQGWLLWEPTMVDFWLRLCLLIGNAYEVITSKNFPFQGKPPISTDFRDLGRLLHCGVLTSPIFDWRYLGW